MRRIMSCAASFGRGTFDSSRVRLPAARSSGQAVYGMRECVHPVMDDAPEIEDEAIEALGERSKACKVFHSRYCARRSASLPTASLIEAKPAARSAAASSRFNRGISTGPA